MVFAVNPKSCVDKCVYPLALNFADFLRLILACGSTTFIEQIINWNKSQFKDFMNSNSFFPEQIAVL